MPLYRVRIEDVEDGPIWVETKADDERDLKIRIGNFCSLGEYTGIVEIKEIAKIDGLEKFGG